MIQAVRGTVKPLSVSKERIQSVESAIGILPAIVTLLLAIGFLPVGVILVLLGMGNVSNGFEHIASWAAYIFVFLGVSALVGVLFLCYCAFHLFRRR